MGGFIAKFVAVAYIGQQLSPSGLNKIMQASKVENRCKGKRIATEGVSWLG